MSNNNAQCSSIIFNPEPRARNFFNPEPETFFNYFITIRKEKFAWHAFNAKARRRGETRKRNETRNFFISELFQPGTQNTKPETPNSLSLFKFGL